MKKLFLFFIAGAVIATGITAFSSMAHADAMTKAEFAELLVKSIGIELPAGSEDLSAEEYFEVMANALAVTGIDDFVGAEANEPVTFDYFVEVTYAMSGQEEDVSIEEKLKYLFDTYGIPRRGLNKTLTPAEAAAFLNNPAFAALIAEGFSPVGMGRVDRAGTEAPGYKFERTATQT
ncbi:MAG: hypothetical protein U9R44_03660 [Candidatus Omnitrophota bacterium]|nr:hypothetical protein [Candidatus Omnitrophota bacterium]